MSASRQIELKDPRLIFLAAAGVLALGGLAMVLDPFKALVVTLGAMIAFVTMLQPIVGLWLCIITNTSLQILGSAHITGAPASLSKIFGVITVAAVLLHLLFARWKITASPIYRALLFYSVPVVVWDMFHTNPQIGPFEGSFVFLQLVVLVFLISTIAGQGRRALDAGVIGLMVAVAGCGVIGLAEHFLPSMAVESDDPATALGTLGGIIDRESLEGVVIKRITGGIGDANWLAYTVAATLPLVIYGWNRWTGFWMRNFILMLAALQMIALVLSFTRTGFLGLGFAVVYLLCRGIVPLRPFLGALAVGALVSMVALPDGFVDRMFSKKYLEEGSTPLREFLVTEAFHAFTTSPWVGHGYKGFGQEFYDSIRNRLPKKDFRTVAWAHELTDAIDEGRERISDIGAHNLYLEVLVEYGVIGFFLYFGIYVVAWREASIIEATGPPHMRILAICLKAGIVAFLTCGLLGHCKYLKIIWFLFGLLMAARRVAAVGDSGEPALLGDRVT